MDTDFLSMREGHSTFSEEASSSASVMKPEIGARMEVAGTGIIIARNVGGL